MATYIKLGGVEFQWAHLFDIIVGLKKLPIPLCKYEGANTPLGGSVVMIFFVHHLIHC